MRAIYHCHDAASSDARGSLRDYARAAAEAGLTALCVTNHVERLEADGSWSVDAGEAIDRFGASVREARELSSEFPDLDLRVGAELEYRREWLPALERLAAEVPLDFLLGSVHVVDGQNVSGGPEVDRHFRDRKLEEAYGGYFEALLEMVEWGAFDAVAHFDLVKRYGHAHYGPYDPRSFEGPIRAVLRRMARGGIGMEVNGSGVVEAPGEPYPGPRLLRWARQEGVPFLTVGTDAHAPEELCQGLEESYRAATEGGWLGIATLEGRRVTALHPPPIPANRVGDSRRVTKETRVRVRVDLDGRGRSSVSTGIGFFDHMLEQLARHSLVDLEVEADGDLRVDEHHTVEDVGLVLGRAVSRALGQRRGIRRYGFLLPMDDALARVAVDLGGRSHVVFRGEFRGERVGELSTELVEEFVLALARGMDATIHVSVEYGRNDHHKVEAAFKALGRALRGAMERDPRLGDELPTTKGEL